MSAKRARNHGQPGRGKQTFRKAVKAVPAIASAFQPGLQAVLTEHRNKLSNRELATGSIDLDGALRRDYPQDHRWDYGIGLPHDSRTEKVLWLESHHAASGETERVINKLQALKAWLQAHAPDLNSMPKSFVWHLTNVEKNPNDRRTRTAQAEKHGLKRV